MTSGLHVDVTDYTSSKKNVLSTIKYLDIVPS